MAFCHKELPPTDSTCHFTGNGFCPDVRLFGGISGVNGVGCFGDFSSTFPPFKSTFTCGAIPDQCEFGSYNLACNLCVSTGSQPFDCVRFDESSCTFRRYTCDGYVASDYGAPSIFLNDCDACCIDCGFNADGGGFCEPTQRCLANPARCYAALNCAWNGTDCEFDCDSPSCDPSEFWSWTNCACRTDIGGWCLHDPYTRYHVVYPGGTDLGIKFERSDHSTPPFAVTATVTTNDSDTRPKLLWDTWRNRLWLVFQRGTAVRQKFSDDDGATWSTETIVFSTGQFPDITQDPLTGAVLRAAVVSGKIRATIQYPGDTAASAEFTFKDDAGADLTVDSDVFHVSCSGDGSGRWLLLVGSSGTITSYASYDDGRTWAVVS